MEVKEDIGIVGAGIAGLVTSLGLHRIGIKSLVLECSDSARTAGYGLSLWTNAWRCLDTLGIGDSLRPQNYKCDGMVLNSSIWQVKTAEMSLTAKGKHGKHEVYCVIRKNLLEALSKELPNGTIRFSSKVVSIEECGFSKLVHLSDGTVIRTKVLIGCDGVNSVVAKWLGFDKLCYSGMLAVRGICYFENIHNFESKIQFFYGEGGVRSGFFPFDAKTIYWYFAWPPSKQEEMLKENPPQMKQFVLTKLGNLSSQFKGVIENTALDSIFTTPLKYRNPLEILLGHMNKGNVCVAGDALHTMTPHLGQGGCSALEDGIVLARCIGKALQGPISSNEEEEYKRIEMALEKYAKERKWRIFEIVTISIGIGFLQESGGKIMNFLRDKCLAKFMASLLLKKADYDCGNLW